jgi:hypothetical protein
MSKGKIGAPTKYKSEYCQQIIDYFNQPLTHTEEEVWTTKGGTQIVKKKEVPNELLFLEDFAWDIGRHDIHTLERWAKKYPEFGTAYAHAKLLQKRQLVSNCVSGRWNSNFGIFTATNMTDMRLVKQEIEASGSVSVKIVKFTGEKKG